MNALKKNPMPPLFQVAFRDCNWLSPGDDLIALYEGAAREVHVEVHVASKLRFSAWADTKPAILGVPFPCDQLPVAAWHRFDLPMRGPDHAARALAWLSSAMHTSNAPWQFNLKYAFMPRSMLPPDDDSRRPSTWKNTFCSHFSLHFVRFCAAENLLALDAPGLDAARKVLWSTHSQLATPAVLHAMLVQILPTGQSKPPQDDPVPLSVRYTPDHPAHRVQRAQRPAPRRRVH